MTRRFGFCIALTVFVLLLGSCRDQALDSREVVCVATPPDGYVTLRRVLAAEWVDVLVDAPGYDKDCSGQWVAPADLPARCPPPEGEQRAKPLSRRENYVVARSQNESFALVWTPVQRYGDGEVGGPVGLVHMSPERFSVVALGNLRLPPNRVALRVEVVAGEEVLFAEGSHCEEAGHSGQCDTELRLMLIQGPNIVPLELRDSGNRCVGPTELGLRRVHSQKLPNGWVRDFVLVTDVDVGVDEVIARESLVATDYPPDRNESRAQVYRRSEAKRTLDFNGAYFESDRPTLWTHMRATKGELD